MKNQHPAIGSHKENKEPDKVHKKYTTLTISDNVATSFVSSFTCAPFVASATHSVVLPPLHCASLLLAIVAPSPVSV